MRLRRNSPCFEGKGERGPRIEGSRSNNNNNNNNEIGIEPRTNYSNLLFARGAPGVLPRSCHPSFCLLFPLFLSSFPFSFLSSDEDRAFNRFICRETEADLPKRENGSRKRNRGEGNKSGTSGATTRHPVLGRNEAEIVG